MFNQKENIKIFKQREADLKKEVENLRARADALTLRYASSCSNSYKGFLII